MKPSATSGLLIFDTHPIQYRSPVFRELYKIMPETHVVFLSQEFDGNRWWFSEVNKSQNINWGLPLGQGFPNETLKSKSRLGRLLEINRIIKQQRPRAVLLYGYYLLEHWLVWLSARTRRIPILFVGETYSPNGPTQGLGGLLRVWLREKFIAGVTGFISIGLRNHSFYSYFGIPNEKIERARYCIDNSFFKSQGDEHIAKRREIREQLGIGEKDLVLLFAGRLFDRKRPYDMIRLHQLLGNKPIHTILVGSGELEQDLKTRTRAMDRFHLVGFKSQNEIRDFYFASDILIVPSEFETWGLVVNEAFACGMTAAVSDTCGTAGDLVVQNETGLVFPVGKIEKLVPMIERLADSPQLLNDLKINAHRKVMAEFTPTLFAETIKSAFEKVAGRLLPKKNSADETTKTAATGT